MDSVTWDEADEYCRRSEAGCRAKPNGSTRPEPGQPAPVRESGRDRLVLGQQQVFTSHPVAQKKPNAFGLYDMLGNVVEWTHTWYWVQHNQENINPTGPSIAEYKELRGGGWWDDPDLVRASYRSRIETTDRGLQHRLPLRVGISAGCKLSGYY